MERQVKCKTGRGPREGRRDPAVLCWRLWPRRPAPLPSWARQVWPVGAPEDAESTVGTTSPRRPRAPRPGHVTAQPRSRSRRLFPGSSPQSRASRRGPGALPPSTSVAVSPGASWRSGRGVGAGTLEQATPGIRGAPGRGPVRGCAGSGVTIGSGRAGRGFGFICSSCWESVRLD